MTAGQLSIFDELAELEGPKETAPAWSPPEIDGECEHCGAPVSSRNPMDQVNHGRIEDTCTSRWLSRSHARSSLRLLDPANRGERSQTCFNHPTAKKPCPQKCFEKEYERHAARATDAWGGDGWKEQP